jgi:hypothetical protein
MVLKIVDAPEQVERAFEVLEATLSAWAGGKSDQWQEDGRNGPRESGASYTRREDVYVFVHRAPRELSVGVALAEKDRDLVRLSLSTRDPARDRKRTALAIDSEGAAFLLVSIEELKRQNIRDPLRRLAGAPQIKRANVSDRDYVLLGPLEELRVAEALLALGGLHPLFERHVERLAALATASDDLDDTELYQVSPRVAKQHRVHAKVVHALFERLRGQGFEVDELRNGAFRADFAMRRRELAIAFEIRAAAELEDVLKAIGQLLLVAPRRSSFARCIVLPAPREALGASLGPFEAALNEAGALVLMYDVKDKELVFWPQAIPEGFPAELVQAFR